MHNAISFSLFGYNQQHESCFEWKSYMRGFHINMRMSEVLYPGWKVCLQVDEPSFNSKYYPYFQAIASNVDVVKTHNAELCRMMLYRMVPIFKLNAQGDLAYDRVICRDTDSLLTYKERQAVAYWEQGTKMAHAITDSVSHTVALMGGMVGFRAGAFRDRMGVSSFEDLLALSQGIDYNRKGADQDFLNRYVLPRVADSITEHYLLGMPQSFRGDCHHAVQDIDLGTPTGFKETNALGFHVGASGFQTDGTVKFLQAHGKNNEYWNEIEKQFPDVFYWML